MWVKEIDDPIVSDKRKATALPHRCRQVKDDGIRCMLWSSGRLNDDGLCRVHLRSVRKKPGEDIERARAKLTQAAPYAVDVLEDMMENAISEPVKLKAATEILDRAGVRGGVEFDATVTVADVRPAAVIIADRLNRLAQGAIQIAGELAGDGVKVSEDGNDIIEAEEVPSEETEE